MAVTLRGLGPLAMSQLRLYVREPIATFFTLLFAPLLLVLFGVIYGNEPNELFGGRGSMDVTVPAYVGLVIVTVGLIGIPIQTATQRELGILRRYRVTPMRPLTYVVADVTVYYLMTVAGVALLVLVGRLAFNVQFEGDVIGLFGGFTLASLSFFALGYLLAGVAPSARLAQTVGMVLAYPMMFLSGASIPLEVLPPGVRQVADFIPLTHVVRLMRGLWAGDPWLSLTSEVAVLAGILIVAAAISVRVFRWE
ncbi:MAG TPA: ABC transporter permease [Candidatus Limnocylindrales bacterium]|nr:ABC transporter permease [Candidatus Limnocylindrales bacterium]